MSLQWRWDQGRTEYFQFESIRRIAATLVGLDNVDLGAAIDPLRAPLEAATDLPFDPDDYRVWRNYKRVFGAAMLAADVGRRMVCTQLCYAVAGQPTEAALSADEYLRHVTQRFYYPSPVFVGYSTTAKQVFPFCAILKFLLASALYKQRESVSLEEVFSFVAGNDCTGLESLTTYRRLKPTARVGVGDETRQVREMLRFLSQFSFLKWRSPELLLDVDILTQGLVGALESLATPIVQKRNPDRSSELLALGAIPGAKPAPLPITVPAMAEDEEFIEGRKVRVTHLRTERSKKLRAALFGTLALPYKCDVCSLIPQTRYPWVDNILEVHHLLPLGSAIRVGLETTSVDDLAPVCPNCHRAVHMYYRRWLDNNKLDDFANRMQALQVYGDAKAQTSVAA